MERKTKAKTKTDTDGVHVKTGRRYRQADEGQTRPNAGIKSHYHPSNPNHLAALSSPLCKPVPTIPSFRFGYTGPHNRRGGTGDRTVRPYAGGPSGAAQKMVCLS